MLCPYLGGSTMGGPTVYIHCTVVLLCVSFTVCGDVILFRCYF